MTALDVGLDADELLRAAQESAYKHPPGFAGFTAGLRIHDGREVFDGTATIPGEGAPDLAVDAPDTTLAWARHELGSMAAHRRHRTYEEGDGRHRKRLAPDDGHPLGRLVELDDAMASTFRVRDGHLAEISRSHGGSRFTIVVQDRAAAPDGRTVTQSFAVVYRDEDLGRLTRTDVYGDEHVALGDVLLPASRQVATADDDGLRVRRIELFDHALLEGARS